MAIVILMINKYHSRTNEARISEAGNWLSPLQKFEDHLLVKKSAVTFIKSDTKA
jgi:hypothetical protein